MRKFNLFLLLAIISIAVKAQIVAGPTSAYEGEKKNYSVTGFDLTKAVTWTVRNGKASGSSGISTAITWDMGATEGYINVIGYNSLGFQTIASMKVQIKKRNSPVVKGLSISNPSNLTAYTAIQLKLNYQVPDDFWPTMQQTVSWTINGVTKTGNPITVTDLKSGSNEIFAKLTFYGYSGSFSTTKYIYVTPAAPPLTDINGPSYTDIGVPVQYEPILRYPISTSNIRYEWEVNMWSSKYYYEGKFLNYTFSALFTNQVTCKAIDIHSGLYATITKDVTVLRPGEDPYSMIISDESLKTLESKSNKENDSFNLIISGNSIEITTSEPTSNSIVSKNSEKVTYQLYSISGKLMTKGTMMGNGRIDISNFPKGIYILKLTDDLDKTTSKKIIIK